MTTYLRADSKDEFLVVINFSNHPIHGKVDVRGGENFQPVKIAGVENSDSSSFSDLHLKGFEWRIYHRSATLAAARKGHVHKSERFKLHALPWLWLTLQAAFQCLCQAVD